MSSTVALLASLAFLIPAQDPGSAITDWLLDGPFPFAARTRGPHEPPPLYVVPPATPLPATSSGPWSRSPPEPRTGRASGPSAASRLHVCEVTMMLVRAVAAMLTAGRGARWVRVAHRDTEGVVAAYTQLVSSLDPAAPGLSLLRLQEFDRQHAQYDLTARLDPQIEAWRARLQSAYLEARDLAREGRFDQAEWMLKDLALVPDEPAGKQAMQFLVFDFHRLKATRLLATGDAAGCGGRGEDR